MPEQVRYKIAAMVHWCPENKALRYMVDYFTPVASRIESTALYVPPVVINYLTVLWYRVIEVHSIVGPSLSMSGGQYSTVTVTCCRTISATHDILSTALEIARNNTFLLDIV